MSRTSTDWHCYNTSPIDHWEGWETASDFIVHQIGLEMAGLPYIELNELLTHIHASAYAVAEQCRFKSSRGDTPIWEGDIRERVIYIARIDGEFPVNVDDVIIGWKQDNNGSTFFAAKRPLPIPDYIDTCDAPKIKKNKLNVRSVKV